jgi:hypothetical protein
MSRTPRRKPRRLAPPKPVVRMTTPAQLVAALPVQLGYTPTESLVVVCCHEPRGRTGLTMRVDLPPSRHEDALVDQVVAIVRGQQATRVVMVIYTEAPDSELLPRAVLMESLVDAFDDLIVTEALLVRDGRFWSYVCEGPCCPAEGTPVDEAEDSAEVQTLRLEQLARGESPLASREALEQSIAGPSFLAQQEASQRCDEASERYADAILEAGLDEARREAIAAWTQALEDSEDPRWQLSPAQSAALSASLIDLVVRDSVAALWQPEQPALRRLLEQVARATPPPHDAPVCTTLAWVTYCDGGGSLTSIALERALRSDPEYSLALLLRHALTNALPPDFVRGVARRTRTALEDCA